MFVVPVVNLNVVTYERFLKIYFRAWHEVAVDPAKFWNQFGDEHSEWPTVKAIGNDYGQHSTSITTTHWTTP